MDIRQKDLPAQPYLYVDRECPMEGPAIAAAMGSGFAEVFRFVEAAGIAPQSMPISVYLEMPAGRMRFRCGVFVSKADAARASGPVKADALPAGPALTATHVGPYASLNQSHGALWTHMKDNGIAPAMPVWEIFVDDPQTTPEADLRTEIYRAVG